MSLDPAQILASTITDLILGWKKNTQLQNWFRLIFQCVASMVGSFLLVCGMALVGGANIITAVGSGMSMSGIILFALLRRSELTKGMIFMAPSIEAEKELHTDTITIERSK